MPGYGFRSVGSKGLVPETFNPGVPDLAEASADAHRPASGIAAGAQDQEIRSAWFADGVGVSGRLAAGYPGSHAVGSSPEPARAKRKEAP